MDFSWMVPIDKLMVWKTNNWLKYEQRFNKLHLRVHYDQLLITSDSKILESFNMTNKMKGIFKEDILILIVSSTGQEIRKIKFQIKTNVAQSLKKLGEMFPVVRHNNSGSSKDCIQSKYRSIDEVLKLAITQKESIEMPSDYKKFIKLCLLDPNFPKVVSETETILKELNNNK